MPVIASHELASFCARLSTPRTAPITAGSTNSENVIILSAVVDMPTSADSNSVDRTKKTTDRPNKKRERLARLRFTDSPNRCTSTAKRPNHTLGQQKAKHKRESKTQHWIMGFVDHQAAYKGRKSNRTRFGCLGLCLWRFLVVPVGVDLDHIFIRGQ